MPSGGNSVIVMVCCYSQCFLTNPLILIEVFSSLYSDSESSGLRKTRRKCCRVSARWKNVWKVWVANSSNNIWTSKERSCNEKKQNFFLSIIYCTSFYMHHVVMLFPRTMKTSVTIRTSHSAMNITLSACAFSLKFSLRMFTEEIKQQKKKRKSKQKMWKQNDTIKHCFFSRKQERASKRWRLNGAGRTSPRLRRSSTIPKCVITLIIIRTGWNFTKKTLVSWRFLYKGCFDAFFQPNKWRQKSLLRQWHSDVPQGTFFILNYTIHGIFLISAFIIGKFMTRHCLKTKSWHFLLYLQYILSQETIDYLKKPTFDIWHWEPNEVWKQFLSLYFSA